MAGVAEALLGAGAGGGWLCMLRGWAELSGSGLVWSGLPMGSRGCVCGALGCLLPACYDLLREGVCAGWNLQGKAGQGKHAFHDSYI